MYRSLIEYNGTAGISVAGTQTAVSVADTAVMYTKQGGVGIGDENVKGQVYGDGVVGAGSSVDISSSILAGNERCGAYYYEARGTMSGSIITGNSSYGLAMESCEGDVVHEGNGNWVFGNALDVPAEEAEQIAVNPKGLPVPAAPGVSQIPERDRR